VPVCVRLDDGHQARVGGLAFEDAHVLAHGARVHLSPGTARGPESCGRATHGPFLPAGVQYVEGQDIHAGDNTLKGITLCDG
jgi:hypothetical protein